MLNLNFLLFIPENTPRSSGLSTPQCAPVCATPESPDLNPALKVLLRCQSRFLRCQLSAERGEVRVRIGSDFFAQDASRPRSPRRPAEGTGSTILRLSLGQPKHASSFAVMPASVSLFTAACARTLSEEMLLAAVKLGTSGSPLDEAFFTCGALAACSACAKNVGTPAQYRRDESEEKQI
jgi:hypothetical protein